MILKNYLYSLGLNFFKIAAPIIIMPFVYRQIPPYEMGLVNLTITIMTYFYITGDLGTYIYGFREVSLYKSDINKLNKFFIELFCFRLFFNSLIILIYIVYIKYFYHGEVPQTFFWIAGVQLLSTFFSVEWFFEGNENFKFVSIKTILVRSFFLILTLLFVRGEHASEFYLFALCAFLLVNNIISFIVVQKYIKWDFKNLKIFRHTKKMIIIFIMINWSMLYFQFDKLILGFYYNYIGVSYYTLAERVVLLSSSIVFSFVTVMTPRLGLDLNESFEKYKNNLKLVFNTFLTIALPISSLVYINSYEITYLIGGDNYIQADSTMKIFSLFIIFYLLLELLKTNILLLLKKENIFFLVVISLGIINVFVKYMFKINNVNILTSITLLISIISVLYLIFFVKIKLNVLLISLYDKNLLLFPLCILISLLLNKLSFEAVIFSFCVKILIFLIVYILILKVLKNQLLVILIKKLSYYVK